MLIDGVEMSSGTVEDFSSGTYVVFDIQGLNQSADGTVISITAEDAPGSPRCETSEVESFNVHISGVFVSGLHNLESNSCGSLIGTPRRLIMRGRP